jgi:hypothetical protein
MMSTNRPGSRRPRSHLRSKAWRYPYGQRIAEELTEAFPAKAAEAPASETTDDVIFSLYDHRHALEQRAIDGTIEDWMTFLHPAQTALVRRNWGGPARINGGPGTGKTQYAGDAGGRRQRPSRAGGIGKHRDPAFWGHDATDAYYVGAGEYDLDLGESLDVLEQEAAPMCGWGDHSFWYGRSRVIDDRPARPAPRLVDAQDRSPAQGRRTMPTMGALH